SHPFYVTATSVDGQLMAHVAPIMGAPLASSLTFEHADLSTLALTRQRAGPAAAALHTCSGSATTKLLNPLGLSAQGHSNTLKESLIKTPLTVVSPNTSPRFLGPKSLLTAIFYLARQTSAHPPTQAKTVSTSPATANPTHFTSPGPPTSPPLPIQTSHMPTPPSAQSPQQEMVVAPVGPPDPTRHLAGHCICTSSGSPIQSWASSHAPTSFPPTLAPHNNDNANPPSWICAPGTPSAVRWHAALCLK
ncbi:hypothetical protein C0993_011222, partial [Termitomyces sp. T159_Od127]